MLGPEKVRALDRPILLSLEQLVPASNFYRHLDATLDLGFVRDWVKERYAANGRPSIDPVVFFKLQLLMFFEGLRSERQLIELASLNLAHRWYLGYPLDEALPDHSSLTRIRDRLGRTVFQRFFERIIELCDEAGLIWGKELFFDATRVRANAAMGRSCRAWARSSATTSSSSSHARSRRSTPSPISRPHRMPNGAGQRKRGRQTSLLCPPR